MKKSIFITLSALVVLSTGAAHATSTYVNGAPSIGSQYGLIQNVQNYSSNPFWDPNGPYNQRMPQPVYVQGADLNTGDCQRVVGALVGAYCIQRNNCVGMTLSDVRPDLMVQLSQIPGHNYASACAGFIDSEFSSYVSKYANAAPSAGGVAFPTPTTPNAAAFPEPEFKMKNPYEIKKPVWQQEAEERAKELRDLQAANGAGEVKLAKTAFPTTVADLTVEQRMQNKAVGYEPYAGKSAYQQLNIESEEKYNERRRAFCESRITPQLAVLKNDIVVLQKCKAAGTKFADCKTVGSYN